MLRGKLFILLMMGVLFLSRCTDSPTGSKDKESQGVYILCEGNFGAPNASLWQFDGEEVYGPIYWDAESNPLGDTGQSLFYWQDKLFIIVNASHSIEVLDTESNEKLASIALPGASPRFMDARNGVGYVTGWNSHGIITIDLKNHEILDTLAVGALAEDIIIDNDMLYTSITMNNFWQSENKVLAYDLSMNNPVAVDTFDVVPGPGQMILKDNELWVASTYYDDAWQTYGGMSKINLSAKSVMTKDYGVTFHFSKDIVEYENQIYRTYKNGLVLINDDLSYDEERMLATVSQKVYSATGKDDVIYYGTTDYQAPDTVYVMKDNFIIDEIKVGALPTTVGFVE
ncbi:MAG: YncE family protein [Fidelibacterota bacterium]